MRTTAEEIKEWLAYSPKESTPTATGLLGQRDARGLLVLCSHCLGRLAGRGITVRACLESPEAIWIDQYHDRITCDGCGLGLLESRVKS